MSARGRLWLVPNTLDLGTAQSDLQDVLPLGAIRTAAGLRHWVVENARSSRALLKRVDQVVPLGCALQDIQMVELPRPPKGRPAAAEPDLSALLAPALADQDVGLMSEAGLPAVADPGSWLVRAAHKLGVAVMPLSGPSSLMLALAASGLNGQSFAFVGYLPTQSELRLKQLRDLEAQSRRWQQTQIVIETPYRNTALLDALCSGLGPGTWLSVSCGLTLAGGFTRTDRISEWRKRPMQLPADVPAVFSFLV